MVGWFVVRWRRRERRSLGLDPRHRIECLCVHEYRVRLRATGVRRERQRAAGLEPWWRDFCFPNLRLTVR